ncbi:hypothetical protein RHGRI_007382 [Rhododendron griersonianum]|uniref:Uncharacterized protein n=1 Tax=Rhododendron griersonianum TaxID=479676 RepID=A0AAV6KWL1_9ERIC|nr:hypothetical protein RHGRI_007382 [Rhododendron griersonianum]
MHQKKKCMNHDLPETWKETHYSQKRKCWTDGAEGAYFGRPSGYGVVCIKSFSTIEEDRKHPDAEIDPNYWNLICDYMKTQAYIMEMMKLNNQPVPEGETPMTEDEICDKVLGRAIGYVRGLGYRVRPNTSTKVAHVMRAQLQECTKRADEADRRQRWLKEGQKN